MISGPKPGDEALSGGTGHNYTYDAWNRLVEVKDGDDVIARYEYDGLGRRVKKHIDSSAPASPDGTIDTWRHFFYNSGWQVLETRTTTSAENDEPEDLQPEYQYVWSPRYIDAAVLRDENKDDDDDCIDGQDERLYYLNDANMNVTALVEDDGDAVERYVYDPYGKVTIYDDDWSETRNSSSFDNCILYCGYYHDWETGLYHVRWRMYHPTLGRWLSRDPIGHSDGMHLYAYVGLSPVTFVDAAGLEAASSAHEGAKAWNEVEIGQSRSDEWQYVDMCADGVTGRIHTLEATVEVGAGKGMLRQHKYYAYLRAHISHWHGTKCSVFLIAFKDLRKDGAWQVYDAPELRASFRDIRQAAKKGKKITSKMSTEMERLSLLGVQWNAGLDAASHRVTHSHMGGVTQVPKGTDVPADSQGFVRGPGGRRVVCALDRESKLILACVHFGWAATPSGAKKNKMETAVGAMFNRGSGEYADLGWPYKSAVAVPGEGVKAALQRYEGGKYAEYRFVGAMDKEWKLQR